MKSISILYDVQHFELCGLVEDSVAILEEKTGNRIDMKICDGYLLLDHLKEKPDYDLVIMHVSREENAHRQARRCREISKAPIVAESSSYPYGRKEILETFDGYTGLLFKENNLESVLIRFGFLS